MTGGNTAQRPVLKYTGSKWRMADWIISLMPPHRSYLEPFFGSGAVFFKKPPSRIETINVWTARSQTFSAASGKKRKNWPGPWS